MIERLFSMEGYGVFVWAAFGFTLFCCSVLYLITKVQLAKQEKKFFLKFGKLTQEKIEIAKKQKINKEILVSKPNYNF
jgi:heme exporter protein D|tara:strand:+ start:335 stop:568 length:234 start_codon:yes stop_codon:yes gene_type:complete